MTRLLSVNVGLPREITWRGKTVYTAVWKEQVHERRLVRRLNIVCHTYECGLISGSVKYDPEPLEPPAAGNLLICCSRPGEDLAIDI